jgi:hypothetical protein
MWLITGFEQHGGCHMWSRKCLPFWSTWVDPQFFGGVRVAQSSVSVLCFVDCCWSIRLFSFSLYKEILNVCMKFNEVAKWKTWKMIMQSKRQWSLFPKFRPLKFTYDRRSTCRLFHFWFMYWYFSFQIYSIWEISNILPIFQYFRIDLWSILWV